MSLVSKLNPVQCHTGDPWLLGLAGGCSGAFAVMLSREGELLGVDQEDLGMDWRESRYVGEPTTAIEVMLDRLTVAAGMTSRSELIQQISHLTLGISGADPRFWPELYTCAIEHIGFSRSVINVSSLSEVAHAAAFAGQPGLLVRAGHGSSAFLKLRDGSAILNGGWGSFVGDVGSASWLGRKLVGLACSLEDGLVDQPAQNLVSSILSIKNYQRIIELLQEVERERYYSGGYRARKRLWELGMHTLTRAEVGDPMARRLLNKAVDQLVGSLRPLLSHIPCDTRVPLCIRGSMATASPLFCQTLVERLLDSSNSLEEGSDSGYSSAVGVGLLTLNQAKPSALAQTRFLKAIKDHPQSQKWGTDAQLYRRAFLGITQ